MTRLSIPAPISSRPQPAAVLELLKPITWFAPMWAYGCGVVSSGQPLASHLPQIALGILLAGPLVCGTSQAANDWYDRHVDAINEPNRPIPSGRIPGRWGLYIAMAWTMVSLAVAALLGVAVFAAACVGLALAWVYSAPPLRLKQNGWFGNAACGLCYESLPWFTGAAALIGGVPDGRTIGIALLYGIGAHGIMTLNDFKSVEGDRVMKLKSLPVQLGVDGAAKLACWVMALPQLVVIALLWSWDQPVHAAIVAGLLLVQLGLMARLLNAPRERAAWYNATGTTLYVLGMLAAAFALRALSLGSV
ncbi:MAG: chlorophyll synthase ChlG [Beijerinckiaceae bacterium]|nr:chlorophyll synthase ChlG [Beijerinckiaceae bacterium]